MPIYEYECSCGNAFEVIVRGFDTRVFVCPKCSRYANRVDYSRTGTPILKGAGFYKPTKD